MCLHGFSKYGKGRGAGPVNYFISENYFFIDTDTTKKTSKIRSSPPEVIEGDPALMIQMIDNLPTIHKYTAGVLSFSTADTSKLRKIGISESVTDITKLLKQMLFSGIPEEFQQILIVSHTHLDRLELHYVTPRWNYEVNRAWNPAPPGNRKFEHMDALTDLINAKYGLDDPRDPSRRVAVKNPRWPINASQLEISDFFLQMVIEGQIENRTQIIEFCKRTGLTVGRVGKSYISIKPSTGEKPIRLKGAIFDEQFTCITKLTDIKKQRNVRQDYLSESKIIQRFKTATQERRAFIEKRFKSIFSLSRKTNKTNSLTDYNSTDTAGFIEDPTHLDNNLQHTLFGNINNSTKLKKPIRKMEAPHEKYKTLDIFKNEHYEWIPRTPSQLSNSPQAESESRNFAPPNPTKQYRRYPRLTP